MDVDLSLPAARVVRALNQIIQWRAPLKRGKFKFRYQTAVLAEFDERTSAGLNPVPFLEKAAG